MLLQDMDIGGNMKKRHESKIRNCFHVVFYIAGIFTATYRKKLCGLTEFHFFTRFLLDQWFFCIRSILRDHRCTAH